MPSPEIELLPDPLPTSRLSWFSLDASTRLLWAIVCLRVATGLLFLGVGYQHWQDDALVREMTSQWIDWTNQTPLFWLQDVYRWLVIPNAWLFARFQTVCELVAGLLVTVGVYHQWGVQLILYWAAIHLLLVAHMQLPFMNIALLGLLLIAGILWLADAGCWMGLDGTIRRRNATVINPEGA